MVAVLRNGRWVDDSIEQQSEAPQLAPPPGLSPFEEADWFAKKENEKQLLQRDKEIAQGGDTRPFLAADPGMFARDLGKIGANALTSLGTDFLDTGAMIGDLVVQSGNLLAGKGWNWDDVADDSDNPWTQARIDTFRAETQAGQAASILTRVGVAALTLPKMAFKGIALPFQTAGKAKFLGGVAGAAEGVGKWVSKLDELANAKAGGMAGTALSQLGKGLGKGTAGQRAAVRASRNDWLGLTYADVAQSIEKGSKLEGVSSWFGNVRQSAKALTQLSKGSTSAKIRTVGQALAWDAFVAFNVYGEGDAQMDETLADLAATSGIPWLEQIGRGTGTATYAEDSGLVRKAKQMLEGVPIGIAMSSALDMVRVYRYAKNFRNASGEDRRLIVEALNLDSEEIGGSIGRALAGGDRFTGTMAPNAMDALGLQVDTARRAAEQKAAFLADQAARPARAPIVPYGPGSIVRQELSVGGPLPPTQVSAGLQGEGGTIVPTRPPDAPPSLDLGGVQGEGGAMISGAVQPVEVRELQQGRLPGSDPAAPALPAVREADRPQGLDPLVQNRLQQMEAGVAPAAEDAAYEDWLRANRGEEYGGPLAPRPVAADGSLAEVPAIEPVQVRELRPSEPVVTPDTIRSAWEREAARAWQQAQALTFQEGTDGVFRSLADGVRRLMPRTRVDALEYLREFRPTANRYGVVHAADSAWQNFIYERGLAEGWATIDPDTMAVRFNRKAAADLDRGQAAIRQAQALDEADSLRLFTERYGGRAAGIQQQLDELLPPGGAPTTTGDPAVDALFSRFPERMAGIEQQRGALGQGLDDMAAGLAREVPEAASEAEAARYQTWLKQQEPMNPGQLQDGPQGALERMEARDAYDAWEAADPGQRLLNDEAIGAAGVSDAIDAAEELRLSGADAALLRGDTTDEEAVMDMLGMRLDEVGPAAIEPAQTGRGWEVYDSRGELLGTARTRKAAEQIAERQARTEREALIARARQMEADEADEAVNVAVGSPVYDSGLTGRVQLSDAQIGALRGLLPRLGEMVDEAAAAGGKTRRTFELSQDEMRQASEAIQAQITEGGARGNQLRVLRTLADKLDSQVKLLEPQARAERFVDDLINDTLRYLERGEFCDPF